MIIPGQFVSLVTFPGVVVHELAHQLMCRRYRIPVIEVCYFRVGNPAGYVLHEKAQSEYQEIMIAVGPFLINTLLGVIIALPAVVAVAIFDAGSPLDYFLYWLGVSIAMHSFPSVADGKNIWRAVKSPSTPWRMKLLVAPLVFIIMFGAAGSVFWLDLLYGITLTVWLPRLLFNLF